MSNTLNECIITLKLSYGEANKICSSLKITKDDKNNELDTDVLIKDFDRILEDARDWFINENLDKKRPNLPQPKIEEELNEREMVCEKCE
mgnify:CR=1 FL=1|tara:strand:+ start:4169 stop:4438 length:270 start_codon:yes stop_codon:yes gene_type:complete